MIQPEDNKTLDLLESPKRGRGRPATGKAMTAAERKRKSRLQAGALHTGSGFGTVQLNATISFEALLALRRSAIHRGLNVSQLIEQLAGFAYAEDLAGIGDDDAAFAVYNYSICDKSR